MPVSISQLASSLFSMSRVMREKGDDPFSQMRLETLAFVDAANTPTMKDIASNFSIAPPSATSLVNALVSAGQLARVTDKNDRRIIRIALTAKGRTSLAAWRRKKLERIERKFAPLNAKEREEFSRILKKLLDHYQIRSR